MAGSTSGQKRFVRICQTSIVAERRRQASWTTALSTALSHRRETSRNETSSTPGQQNQNGNGRSTWWQSTSHGRPSNEDINNLLWIPWLEAGPVTPTERTAKAGSLDETKRRLVADLLFQPASNLLSLDLFLKNPPPATTKKTPGTFPTAPLRGLVAHQSVRTTHRAHFPTRALTAVLPGTLAA